MKNNKIRELFEQLQDELERILWMKKGRDLVDHITVDITNLLDDSGKQPDETIRRVCRTRLTISRSNIPN